MGKSLLFSSRLPIGYREKVVSNMSSAGAYDLCHCEGTRVSFDDDPYRTVRITTDQTPFDFHSKVTAARHYHTSSVVELFPRDWDLLVRVVCETGGSGH